jgi:hypothetical protein
VRLANAFGPTLARPQAPCIASERATSLHSAAI